MKIYINGVNDITGEEYANTYAVILALTFVDTYFDRTNVHLLKMFYFKEDYSYVLSNRVIGINPFKGKILLNTGEIRHHQFYKPKSYRRYY